MDYDKGNLKEKFLDTFEFYERIYNCKEKMLEWRKIKYDLKYLKKFETKYKELKEIEFK